MFLCVSLFPFATCILKPEPIIKSVAKKKIPLGCGTPQAKQRVRLPPPALSVTDLTSDVDRVNKIVWEENVM